MFGKKKVIEEQNKNLLAQLSEKREAFESSLTEIEDRGMRIHTDLCQVMENSGFGLEKTLKLKDSGIKLLMN